MFDPSKYQTLQPFFELSMGGLNRIYEGPNIPIEMVFTQSIKEGPRVQFTLFDEVGWEVEPYIWKSRDPKTRVPGGTFKFGYKGDANVESDEYSFQFQNIKIKYQNNAFYPTIYGFVSGISLFASSNQYNGTVEDILKDIAKDHDYDLVIEPKFGKEYMQEQGSIDRNSTARREMQHSKQMSDPDFRFVQRLLYHARDAEGKVGYHCILTCKDGKKTMLITKSKDSSADYKYEVQAEDSVVVEWNPDVTFAAIFDQSDTQFNSHQKATGYTQKTALAQEITKDFQETFGNDVFQTTKSTPATDPPDKIDHICAESMPDNVTNGAIRIRSASARTPFAGKNGPLHSHGVGWMGLNTATLVVAGDPRVTVQSKSNAIATCDVKFYTPINYFNTNVREEHYSSGLWQVVGVTQRVGLDGFTTTYDLQRAGHSKLPESQQQQQ